MESIHVRQRLRPSRYAFIVNEGDLAQARQAASINAAIWGGVYNPIVPLTPDEDRLGLIKAFDPDFLVNLTGASLTAEAVQRHEHRVVDATDLVRIDHASKRRELGLGFSILPLLSHAHEKEVKFARDLTRAALVVPAAAPGWAEYVAFAFGSFGWLPDLDTKFEDLFRGHLSAHVIELPDLTPPPDHETLVLPLDFTRYGLRRSRRSANFSSHVAFVGDHRNAADLIAYWNIRATGRRVIFVPVEAYRAFEPLVRSVLADGRYPLNPRVDNSADLQKSPSLSGQAFAEVCDWIVGLGVDQPSRRDWQPRFGVEIERYVGDIYVAELHAAESDDISILEKTKMTPVKIVLPPYPVPGSDTAGQHRWSVEVTMTGAFGEPDFMFSFPNEPAVEAAVRRSVLGMPGEVRLGRGGIVLQQDRTRSRFFPAPVPTKDVIHALFHQAGLDVEASLPGQYAEQIIKKMGSLHGGCRVFKLRGVRQILDELGNGSRLTQGNMYQRVTSTTADAHGQNWRSELYDDLVLKFGQARPLKFSAVFDVLLENRILRPGFSFRCGTCIGEDWYHVSEFTEEYTCRFCFTSQRVDFSSAREWQYKSDGLFRIPDSAQGSVGVILALWRFENSFHQEHGRYLTSRNVVVRDTGSRHEIDYAYVVMGPLGGSYELVLGQANRFGDFSDTDMKTMADLADRFPRRPYLAFSTLKDRHSDADRARLRDLVARGYKVIALTREELDPYDLYDRFDRAPHKYAVTLDDLSENTVQLNVGTDESPDPAGAVDAKSG